MGQSKLSSAVAERIKSEEKRAEHKTCETPSSESTMRYGSPRKRKRKKGAERTLEKKMIEILPNLMKHMDLPTDTRNTRNSK